MKELNVESLVELIGEFLMILEEFQVEHLNTLSVEDLLGRIVGISSNLRRKSWNGSWD